MIKKITVKNYILINELTVEFDNGLNIITGETGAGKSILINAIDLAFGARTDKEMIKSGEDKASIELVIENTKHDLKELFVEYGIDDFGSEIIITKEITPASARSRVNGTLVNQEFIKKLKGYFLDIHSQHQTYSYLQPKFHINLLDSYSKNVTGKLLTDYKLLYKQYLELLNELEQAKNSSNATESQIEFLQFQIKEIEDAQIENINEDEELKNELSVLENAEKLKELTGSAYWAINNDDESVLNALNQIKMNITKASRMDSQLEEVEQNLISAMEQLKDVASFLRDYSQNMQSDTERLNFIQERLFLLDKLKRKYGNTLEAVLDTFDKLNSELNAINFSTENVERLEMEIKTTKNKLYELGTLISQKRKDFAQILSAYIVEKLEKLELPKAKFEIAVSETELNPNGIDSVEFLISTNISEPVKPLAKVASGGEISRVMLAIKGIFAQSDDIDTAIFDEIDTGISGKTSQSVAEEVMELAKYRQIIMITHQAIIASKADKHFYVSKSQNDQTKVNITLLSGENKLNAIAELAGGEVNEKSLEFAKTLIK